MEKDGRKRPASPASGAAGKQHYRYAESSFPSPAESRRARPRKDLDRRTALILYGSETGNTQDVADEIGSLTERLRFNTTVLDLDSVQLRDLVQATVVVFAVSTTGQGELPQNARAFWKALLSSALKPGCLRKLRFTSFGLGDSSYPQYNVAHRMLHGRLIQLGAHAFCERGEGNEQHPEGHNAGFREWIVIVKKVLMERFPLPDRTEIIPDDVFIEPKWKLEVVSPEDRHAQHAQGVSRETSSLRSGVPSHTLLPFKGAFTALIKHNDRITAADHFQDVRLLDFRIPDSVSYGPGAVAVIYPKNFPEDVQQFIDLMGWQDIADVPLQMVMNQSQLGHSSSPSPLRHLYLKDTLLTIRWLLETIIDIMSIPRRSFFASLAHFAGTSTGDEQYQRERLLELANPELIDELWDYTTRPKRTILEAMMDFTTMRIPWQYALSALPLMRARQFSIASGGTQRTDDNNQTRLELLIAIVDPPSPIIKYRRRYGVCTRYITSIQAGQHLTIGIHPGYLNIPASDIALPAILIGPGTGLAPMRALIQQRLEWHRAAHPTAKPATALANATLFFGCRSPTADDFFRAEWTQLAETAGLTVFTAYSRDGARPRQYVQDLIRAHGAHVYDALVAQGGKVYVCGSSGEMPKGVRRALGEVLETCGGMAAEESEGYLEAMEKAGRYKQETW